MRHLATSMPLAKARRVRRARNALMKKAKKGGMTVMQQIRVPVARNHFEVWTRNMIVGTILGTPVQRPRRSVVKRRRRPKAASLRLCHFGKGEGKDNGGKKGTGGKLWKKTKQGAGVKSLESQEWPAELARIKSLQAEGSFLFALGESDETPTVRLTRATDGSRSSASEDVREILRSSFFGSGCSYSWSIWSSRSGSHRCPI